ncbi:MAG: MoaD/ThiS family protein [Bacteroidia bacterium]|nr:MoaD/ThiS family protein [Bacteroidia bacterium]
MSLKILFFGQLTDFVKKSEINSDYYSDTRELINFLETEYPQLKNIKYSVSVNNTIVNEIYKLKENDEIALLPPFSGG